MPDFDNHLKIDLGVVDLGADDADNVCSCLKKRGRIPLILIVPSAWTNWSKLASFEAEGYLWSSMGDKEMAARLAAMVRRFLPDAYPENIITVPVVKSENIGAT